MTWVRHDDGFADKPEMVGAGPIAFALACWALSYSARHLTDGSVALEVLAGCPWVSKRSALDRACGNLERAGFWKLTARSYEIVDPFQYLQKSDDVREKRAANAERQARWREKQQAKRNGASNGVTGKSRNAPPDPTPVGVGSKDPIPYKGDAPSDASLEGSPPGGALPILRCPFCPDCFEVGSYSDDHAGDTAYTERTKHVLERHDRNLADPGTIYKNRFAAYQPGEPDPTGDVACHLCGITGVVRWPSNHEYSSDVFCRSCLVVEGIATVDGSTWNDEADRWETSATFDPAAVAKQAANL